MNQYFLIIFAYWVIKNYIKFTLVNCIIDVEICIHYKYHVASFHRKRKRERENAKAKIKDVLRLKKDQSSIYNILYII